MTGTFLYKKKKIGYKFRGEGNRNTIVLLHGFLETMNIWNNLGNKLSKDFQVISIDLPGFGKSEMIESTHTMDLMAEVVNKMLVSLGVKKCMMVGHSMGGYVALAFAEKHLSKLRGLVLFHSHASQDTPEAKVNRERSIKVIKSDRGNFIYHFMPDLFAPDNVERFQTEIQNLIDEARSTASENVIAAQNGMKLRTDKLNFLAKAAYPIMFIAGKKDSRIPIENIIEQAKLPKHSELIMLSEVGHMGFIEARAKTEQIIQSFARRVF